jgi:dTDP-4-dehydrorhamnose 3,5-epimerase-like enzyme
MTELRQVKTHSDDRGFFREIIKGDNLRQVNHSMKFTGYFTPEFHLHKNQTDYWYVPIGVIKAVVVDMRGGRGRYQEFLLGEGQPAQVLTIPPNHAHGFTVLAGPAHLIYVTDREYDPGDEGRVELDYDWNRAAFAGVTADDTQPPPRGEHCYQSRNV